MRHFFILSFLIFWLPACFAVEGMMKHVWTLENRLIQIIHTGDLKVDDLRLSDPNGNPIAFTFQRKDGEFWNFTTKESLKKYPFIRVDYFGKRLFSKPHYKYLNQNFYYEGPLGVYPKGNKIGLSLWSPTAKKVSLLLYKSEDTQVYQEIEMEKGPLGTWNLELAQSFKGLSYMYRIQAFDSETIGLDPYAKTMEAFNPKKPEATGRGVLIPFKTPKERKSLNNMANAVDFIGYEAHIRDFSISENGGGTYGEFEKRLDHIKDLGITHIQFMPLQNFYTVDENNRQFQGHQAPKNNINYNWGYDPMNYFTPEGHFSKNASDPLLRVKEVKALFEKSHKKNIGVILDVVYNHLYDQNSLENAAPAAYMRRNSKGEISFHSGAGASLESRNLMTRRLIIDSLKWWKNYYGVDGFRFDLMGFTDIETMKEIRKALGEDTILYGEAWEFTDLPHHEAMTKSQLPEGLAISAFNDTSRDSYTGSMQGAGFVQGLSHELPKVRAGIVGGLFDFPTSGGLVSFDRYHRFAKNPVQALNYLTIHDGFTLWDKINLSVDGSLEKRKRLLRQAYTMLLTSQGRIILHGGVEMARTKPLAKNDPNPDRAHTSKLVNTENGIRHFHENTYKSPDTTNAIDWKRKSTFQKEFDYLKKLIELRRRVPALRFFKGENIKNGLRFLGRSQTWPPAYSAGYNSFNDPKLDELTIRFINAPKEARQKAWYLAGEVHPKGVGGEGKNPLKNRFSVKFNQEGMGELTLKRSHLKTLDLTSWSDPDGLNIKLVNQPGKWGTINSSYTTLGNNSINPLSIDKDHTAIIDLSIVNHDAGRGSGEDKARIAFTLDNTLEKKSVLAQLNYKKLLMAHNGENAIWNLDYKDLRSTGWKIILDAENIDFNGLKRSLHQIKGGRLIIAPQSSVILIKN